MLTLLYGQLVVVLGLLLPLLSLAAPATHTAYSELFYIWLILASITYLLFLQVNNMLYQNIQITATQHP